jgi:hypothetical protein
MDAILGNLVGDVLVGFVLLIVVSWAAYFVFKLVHRISAPLLRWDTYRASLP